MNFYKEIYIVFGKSRNAWLNFLCKDFRHLECMFKSEDRWINVTPRFDRVKIELIDVNDDEIEMFFEYTDSIILKVKVDKEGEFNRLSFNPFNQLNCVSITKQLIGLRGFIYTPKQLYKRLLKMKRTNIYKNSIEKVEELKDGNWK